MTLADRLRERIVRDGPIGVDAWMAACNAHYYATRDPLGAAGDFTTAPEISQMFGELVGAALADVWLRAGAPAEAIFVELGPGRGTLAQDALRVLRSGGFTGDVHLVETSPTLRAAQRERLPDAIWHERLASIPLQPVLGVGNEYFDALPVKQFIGEKERKIDFTDRFHYTALGKVREVSPARETEVSALAAHLANHGGAALIIDYGHPKTAPGETLQAVRSHAVADPLTNPGEHDLTAHIDFEALAKAATGVAVTPLISQGTWLERLGIGARAMALAAGSPERTEEIAVARRRLCDRAEMGELFKVIALHSEGWPEPAGFRA